MSRLTAGPSRPLVALGDHVSALAVSGDGSRLAVGSLAGDSAIIDLRSGDVVAALPGHSLGVLAAAWSPDGALLATGGQDGVLRIADRDGGTVESHALGSWVGDVMWSPGGVLAAAAGRVVIVRNTDGAMHHLPAAVSTVTALRWAANGTRLGVAAYGGVTWFDTDRLPLDRPARRHDFKGSPLALALSPTGKWACAGYQDASIHLWPLWSGDELTMSGYPAKIELLDFRHDGRWLASACLAELTCWDFAGKGPKGTRPAVGDAHRSRITWLGWQPGGSWLASADQDGQVLFWRSPASTGADLTPSGRIEGDVEVATAAWLPDGTALLVGRHDGTVSRHSTT